MSLNSAPAANRIHIGIFGKRNAGKSSVINAVTGQNLAIVSDIKGTTTDPVLKTMELLPLGPVVIIDTPGLDDQGELGQLRIQKAYQILNKTDIAVLVVDGTVGMTAEDTSILDRIQKKNIPYIIAMSKSDLVKTPLPKLKDNIIWISTTDNTNIYELKNLIAKQVPTDEEDKRLIGDYLSPSDFVVLVIPIDSSAPKGRLILPQQQTIRDILESDASAIAVKETNLKETLKNLSKPPRLVITDSQAFERVAKETPLHIPLTSFSILFARYKGNLSSAVEGARALSTLNDGDTVLISEGCTHHRQCEDIGTVKLPKWIRDYSGKNINFEFTSGTEFPSKLSPYKIIIHCGGCTLNEREMQYRIRCAADAHVPMTNYGTAIAQIHGVLERSIEIFGI